MELRIVEALRVVAISQHEDNEQAHAQRQRDGRGKGDGSAHDGGAIAAQAA